MRTWMQSAVFAIIFATANAAAADTSLDLGKVPADSLQRLNVTITMPGEATVEIELGKYVVQSPGNFTLSFEKAFDGNFATQKKLDLEYFESTKIVEEKPNYVLYQSKFLGDTKYRFLVFQKVGNEGVFCRLVGESVALEQARKAIAACLSLKANE